MKVLFNGNEMEFDAPIKIIDVMKGAGIVDKNILAMKVNGKPMGLTDVVDCDCELVPITFEDEEGKSIYRHTSAHILAQAVKNLYPTTKLAIGPSIKNGFYYDFEFKSTITTEDLANIEKEMQKIIKANYSIKRKEIGRADAATLFANMGEDYKIELLEAIDENEAVSLFEQGNFVDLCRGPHLSSTGKVKAIKLTSIAGAYWRGDSKKKMLTRIYGTSFDKKADLDECLLRMEEAKKRDHRKIGRELDLFDILDEGPGFPFFYPKGMILRNVLEDYWREVHRKAGYAEIKTPIILSEDLWHRSGHWEHYKDNMYVVTIDDEDYAIKPMNCPGGMLTYKRKPHSYRDLPVRMGELGLVHRHELSGALHGLTRVRCFTQDDAHIFMTPEQTEDELVGVMKLIDNVYKVFGLKYSVELSTRPEDSMGTEEQWNMATDALRAALARVNMPYVVNEGDGAFYGPKIDFHIEDCIGRTWQCGTIQLDFQMPERFDLTYIGNDGEKHRPVMIHRVVYGSIERFIAILTEHFAGAFPIWLSPVQVKVMSITDRSSDTVNAIVAKLEENGIRAEADTRNEKIGLKIREAQLNKAPYMLIVGDKEVESQLVSVRDRKDGDLGSMSVDDFIARVDKEIKNKVIK
ncbi:MAG: threonine--tRNA ligase [Clostridia bacterium]|nr:threonine--tRNA ligase [Clostridia bacterium]